MSMEGEALLGRTFPKARLAAPSIIFFDEADAIAPKRGQGGNSGSTISERLVFTLLTEMDGLEQNRLRESLYWLPKIFLRQLMLHFCMRPGRFDLVLHVPPPVEDKRVCLEILWIHTRNMKFGQDRC